MMKRYLSFAAILGMAVFGLALSGCAADGGGGGAGDTGLLTVRNLPSAGANVTVYKNSAVPLDMAANDAINNPDHKSPFKLSKPDTTPFTETGVFYVRVIGRGQGQGGGTRHADNVPFTNGSAELDWATMDLLE
jgi:hypothetical protein